MDPDTIVSVDEMQYKSHDMGTAHGWAPSNRRAIQIDDGKGTGESVMFIAAMSTKVLPITLPVPSPLTVKGFMFEFWCMHFLITAMRAPGSESSSWITRDLIGDYSCVFCFGRQTWKSGSCPRAHRGFSPSKRCS